MVVKQSRELAVLDNALRMLERARSLDEIKEVRDKAETARAHAKRAKWGLQFQNLAAEIKLRAERNAGNFLASLKLRGGDRRSKLHHVTVKIGGFGDFAAAVKAVATIGVYFGRRLCQIHSDCERVGPRSNLGGLAANGRGRLPTALR
jgi:hypothetical protein